MELKNKVVVITGGSRGFGLEVARLFRNEGSRVIVCAKNFDVSEEGVIQKVCDVTNEEEVKKFIKNIINEFGEIDIFINNAGVWLPQSFFEEIDLEKAKKMFDVNLWGNVYVMQSLAAYLKERKQGAIVNIISTSALSPRPKASLYSASKFAQDGFTKAVREELRPFGIKVLSFFPCGMKTLLFDEKKPPEYDTFWDPKDMALKLIENIKKENPEEEVVIKRN